MVPKLLAALLRFSAISLVAGDYVQNNEQTPLSLEQTLHDNQIVQETDNFKVHGPVHPIPPHRNPSTDPWGLSNFTNTTYHNSYHPLFEIDSFMDHLAALYPEHVSLYELGHSAEGREMLAMHIHGGYSEGENVDTKRKTGTPNGKKGFVIMGAQHAREWIASATALYLAHALASNASATKGALSHLLTEYDFHIIPVPNPDGYVYTWESDRFWYKNRMPLGPDEACVGLDMNRNWGYRWSPTESPDYLKEGKKKGTPGPGPADPCSHWYPGRRPFEAPEVNNIANHITRLPNIEGFLDLRSYGQMVSWPFSFTCDLLPPDAEDLFEAALGMAHAVKKKHGTTYTSGSLCSMLYPAPGNILDWMYGDVGVTFAYAAHLRDTGTYGYALPSEWIRPVGEETATMLEYLAAFIKKPRF